MKIKESILQFDSDTYVDSYYVAHDHVNEIANEVAYYISAFRNGRMRADDAAHLSAQSVPFYGSQTFNRASDAISFLAKLMSSNIYVLKTFQNIRNNAPTPDDLEGPYMRAVMHVLESSLNRSITNLNLNEVLTAITNSAMRKPYHMKVVDGDEDTDDQVGPLLSSKIPGTTLSYEQAIPFKLILDSVGLQTIYAAMQGLSGAYMPLKIIADFNYQSYLNLRTRLIKLYGEFNFASTVMMSTNYFGDVLMRNAELSSYVRSFEAPSYRASTKEAAFTMSVLDFFGFAYLKFKDQEPIFSEVFTKLLLALYTSNSYAPLHYSGFASQVTYAAAWDPTGAIVYNEAYIRDFVITSIYESDTKAAVEINTLLPYCFFLMRGMSPGTAKSKIGELGLPVSDKTIRFVDRLIQLFRDCQMYRFLFVEGYAVCDAITNPLDGLLSEEAYIDPETMGKMQALKRLMNIDEISRRIAISTVFNLFKDVLEEPDLFDEVKYPGFRTADRVSYNKGYLACQNNKRCATESPFPSIRLSTSKKTISVFNDVYIPSANDTQLYVTARITTSHDYYWATKYTQSTKLLMALGRIIERTDSVKEEMSRDILVTENKIVYENVTNLAHSFMLGRTVYFEKPITYWSEYNLKTHHKFSTFEMPGMPHNNDAKDLYLAPQQFKDFFDALVTSRLVTHDRNNAEVWMAVNVPARTLGAIADTMRMSEPDGKSETSKKLEFRKGLFYLSNTYEKDRYGRYLRPRATTLGSDFVETSGDKEMAYENIQFVTPSPIDIERMTYTDYYKQNSRDRGYGIVPLEENEMIKWMYHDSFVLLNRSYHPDKETYMRAFLAEVGLSNYQLGRALITNFSAHHLFQDLLDCIVDSDKRSWDLTTISDLSYYDPNVTELNCSDITLTDSNNVDTTEVFIAEVLNDFTDRTLGPFLTAFNNTLNLYDLTPKYGNAVRPYKLYKMILSTEVRDVIKFAGSKILKRTSSFIAQEVVTKEDEYTYGDEEETGVKDENSEPTNKGRYEKPKKEEKNDETKEKIDEVTDIIKKVESATTEVPEGEGTTEKEDKGHYDKDEKRYITTEEEKKEKKKDDKDSKPKL